MTRDRQTAADRSADRDPRLLGRRRLLALTGSAGVALLAGCSGDGSGNGDGETGANGSGTGSGGNGGDDAATATESTKTGTFRLLISDQPVAIDEFDSLAVSFDRARVFRSGGDDGGDGETATATATATEPETATATPTDRNETTATPEGTATPTATPEDGEGDGEERDDESEADDEGGDDGDGSGGFSVIDLGGATVDLTQVVGDKALGVFEGGLPAGRYTKIELHAAEIGGVVDGEAVDVKLPSGKLQITKPFEVTAGGSVSFVFDITVVKKGNGGYNLKPVISQSGVAGTDVDVEEVGDGAKGGDAENGEKDEETETAEAETETSSDDDTTATGAGGGREGTPTAGDA